MSNHSSAGSFCSLVVATTTGATDSVTSLDVSARGNGAECYCIANASVYRYNATSTQTAVPNTDAYLVPLSGGGCWFQQNAEAFFQEEVLSTAAFNGAAFGTIAQNVWHALPLGSNFFSVPTQSALFNVNLSSGGINYVGPTGMTFLINATLSVVDDNPVGGRTDQIIEMAITINGSIIGTTAASVKQSSTSVSGLSGAPAQISLNSVVRPTNGQTLLHALRCVSPSPGTFTGSRYSAVITSIG